jgi:hypothetical protein
MFSRRVAIATIVGLLTGLFCAWGTSRRVDLDVWILAGIVFSRTVAGFAIGISKLKMPWWLHGPVLGLIFGIPVSVQAISTNMSGFYALLGASVVYGFIIELITSVIFKARQQT